VIAYKHYLNYHSNFLDESQANACIENLIKQNNEKRMIINKVNSRRVLIQKSSNDITALANPASQTA
jgi:hypothetical protein